jgi:hypothetical protein
METIIEDAEFDDAVQPLFMPRAHTLTDFYPELTHRSNAS